MKKQLLIIGIIVLLIAVGLSGCLENNKENNGSNITPLSGKVTATTNKIEYRQNETINITIFNGLNVSIFSHSASFTPDFCIENIEKKTSEGWQSFFVHCQDCKYDIDAPGEIKSGQSASFEWRSRIWITGNYSKLEPGVYRLVIYYQIREGNLSETWAWQTVYSNEFIIFDNSNDVLITTDKAEYQQGENINFTINSLSGNISYLVYDCDKCYLNEERFKIHFLNGSNWTYIPTGRDPSEIICAQCVSSGPKIVSESTPCSGSWDQQQRDTGQVKPGIYRISTRLGGVIKVIGDGSGIYYSNEFTIKEMTDEEKLVGTWSFESGEKVWVFNKDKTATYTSYNGIPNQARWSLSNDTLCLTVLYPDVEPPQTLCSAYHFESPTVLVFDEGGTWVKS